MHVTLGLKSLHQNVGYCANDEWIACIGFVIQHCAFSFDTQAVLGSCDLLVVIRDVVALQREARSAKKELKTMFKEEAVKQHRRMAAPPSSVVPLS